MVRIKSLLPVSSRSFHQRNDAIERGINDISTSINMLSERLYSVEKELYDGQRALDSRGSVYLVCEPGYPNYGDELIAKEWLKYYQAHLPGRTVFVDCARPGPASTILYGSHSHMVVVDTVSRISLESAEASNPENNAAHLSQSLDNPGMEARYAMGIRMVQEHARLIHFSGGGYLNSMWKPNLGRLGIASWAKNHGYSVVGTGIGLTPLDESDCMTVRNYAACFDRLGVRDTDTFEVLQGCERVNLMPDDCFVNGLKGCYSQENDIPKIMVCVQSDFSEEYKLNDVFAYTESMLKEWGVLSTDRIGVVECVPYGDYSIFEYLRDHGFSCELFPLEYLLRVGFPAVTGQRWLTTRYHPHLLAAARGCQGSYITLSSSYYRSKHEAAIRMGSSWTEARLDGGIPNAGEGFKDTSIVSEHMRAIRKSVEPVLLDLCFDY